MQPFDHFSTIRFLFGCGKLNALPDLLKEFQAQRVLVVSDPGLVAAGHVDKIIQLVSKEAEALLFIDVKENPETRDIQAGVDFCLKNGGVDLIIGFGGGSAMDTAKGINFLLTNGGTMEDYWGFGKATKPMLKSIGIPTTAGTGSEAQSYALISQEGTHRKMACGDYKARFAAVILDPELTLTLPREVTAVSGFDAITHCVESHVTKTRNAFSQMFSREGFRLLEQNYEIALQHPENIEARSAMLLGAHYAGIAIENSMLGAAHACANPLTSQFSVPHGSAVGMMIPHVIEFNSSVVSQLYAELFGSAEGLKYRLQEFQNLALMPRSLSHFGVTSHAVPSLVEEAMLQWTGKHNPRPLEKNDFRSLYEAAL